MSFRTLTRFQAPHYGLFWQRIRKDFPRTRTVAPLPSGQPVEVPVGEPVPMQVMFNAAEMPRVWFISEDDAFLVQLQPDRLIFNWREGKNLVDYPRFRAVKRKYRSLFQKFSKFVSETELGEIVPIQTELTYINHIKHGQGWSDFGDLGEIFSDFSWRRGSRFIPGPRTFNFRTTHDLAGGTLTVTVQSARATQDRSPAIRFDLSARGSGSELEGERIWKWYDTANIWIVDAFVELTSKHMQETFWERVR